MIWFPLQDRWCTTKASTQYLPIYIPSLAPRKTASNFVSFCFYSTVEFLLLFHYFFSPPAKLIVVFAVFNIFCVDFRKKVWCSRAATHVGIEIAEIERCCFRSNWKKKTHEIIEVFVNYTIHISDRMCFNASRRIMCLSMTRQNFAWFFILAEISPALYEIEIKSVLVITSMI